MLLQRFESTFFQLLSIHNEILKSLKVKVYNISIIRPQDRFVQYTGRQSFSGYKELLFSTMLEAKYSNDIEGLHQLYIQERDDYNSFFIENKHDLGHYFRNLYRFIKFIVEFNGLSDETKNDYIDLIRAQ